MMQFVANNSDRKLKYKKEMLKLKGKELYDYYQKEVLPANIKKTEL